MTEIETPSRQVSVESVQAFESRVIGFDGRYFSSSEENSPSRGTFALSDLTSHFRRLSNELQRSLRNHLEDVLRTELANLVKDSPLAPSTRKSMAPPRKNADPGKKSEDVLHPAVGNGTAPTGNSPFATPYISLVSEYDDDAEDVPLLHRGYLAKKVYETMAPLQGLEVLHDDEEDHGQHYSSQRKSLKSVKSAKSFALANSADRSLHASRESPRPDLKPPPEEDVPVMELETLRITANGDRSTQSSALTQSSKDSAMKEAWGTDANSLWRKKNLASNPQPNIGVAQSYDLRAAKVNRRSAPKKMKTVLTFSRMFHDKKVAEGLSTIVQRCGKYIVEKTYFDVLAGAAILFYSITIGIEVEWLATNLQEDPPIFFEVVEIMFCVFFALELCVRLAAYQSYFFYGDGALWNWLDAFLVITQVVDLIVAACIGDAAERTTNVSFLRILRVLRLVRVIRLVRLVRLMSELRSMLGSIMTSVKSLFFTLVLISFLVFIMGVFLTQLAVEAIRTSDDSVTRDDLRQFATLEDSFLVLFQSLTGGVDWGGPLEPLMKHTSPFVGIAYCLYISFGVLCMLNVITGVFVESACNSTQEEKDANMVSRLQQFLCNHTDKSYITWDEFSSRLDDPELREYFKTVDLDISEAHGLFKLLDSDDSGTVEAEEFVLGCLRLRGVAKAVDLATLMYENRRWHKRIERLTRRVDQVMHNFSTQLLNFSTQFDNLS